MFKSLKIEKDESKNFFEGLFNQIQMSLNFNKVKIFDKKFNKILKDDFHKLIDNYKQNEIDVYFYNLSVKDKKTLISKIYEKETSELYNNIKNILEFCKKNGFSKGKNEFKEKVVIIDNDVKNNKLFIYTPFAVKNNVGNFYELFHSTIQKEHIKFSYIKINGFKLTLQKNTNSLEGKMTEEGFKSIIKDNEEEIKIYFIKGPNL